MPEGLMSRKIFGCTALCCGFCAEGITQDGKRNPVAYYRSVSRSRQFGRPSRYTISANYRTVVESNMNLESVEHTETEFILNKHTHNSFGFHEQVMQSRSTMQTVGFLYPSAISAIY